VWRGNAGLSEGFLDDEELLADPRDEAFDFLTAAWSDSMR
jgi:hypothetical protein